MASSSLDHEFLASAQGRFRQYEQLGRAAVAQCSDADLVRELSRGSNSIAVIVKHVRGNMRSRWTDFLTTDGEKPTRNRDREFDDEPSVTRDVVLQWWSESFVDVFGTLASLRADDLARSVTIRGQPMSVIDAIHRSLTHMAYHVGQIVMLAKIARGDAWTSLSIPRGQSEQFNQSLQGGR